MYFQLTNAGAAALQANPATAPTSFVLGSASGYVPSATDTNIHGSQVYKGGVSKADQVNGNVLRYSLLLQPQLGPFNFGEVGLFLSDGTLFALGAAGTLLPKVIGKSFRFDAYVSSVGTNYAAWLNVSETSNSYHMGVMQSVDTLPMDTDGQPQAYTILRAGAADTFRAFSSGTGLWSFDDFWPDDTTFQATAATTTSVTIARSSYDGPQSADVAHPILLEFASGFVYSTCRTVTSVVISGSTVTLSWATPMARSALVGEQFYLFYRRPRNILAGPGIVITDDGRGILTVSAATSYKIAATQQVTYSTTPAPVVIDVATSGYTLQQGLPGSVIYLMNAALHNLTLAILVGSTQVGTVSIPKGQTSGSIQFVTDVPVNVGTTVTVNVVSDAVAASDASVYLFVSILGKVFG